MDSGFGSSSELDSSNFDDTVCNNEFVVVTFYVSGCRHFEKLTPKLEEAKKVLSGNGMPILFAKVKVEEYEEEVLATKYCIWTYPAIMVFRDCGKKPEQYHGPLQADAIVECLKRLVGPFPTKIESAEDAQNLIGREKTVIVGVFPNFSGEEYKNFVRAAEILQFDYDFAVTLDIKHLPDWESPILSGPVVRVFKPVSSCDQRFVDTRTFNVDALVNFVEQAIIPVVTFYNRDPRLDAMFFSSNIDYDKVILYINREGHGEYEIKYCEVATDKKEESISFMLGYLGDSQDAIEYFELHESKVPLIVIRNPKGETYVKVDLEGPGDIAIWLGDYKAGNLEEYGTPSRVNTEPVKVEVVVSDNFEKKVMESGQHVLLWLGPWCHWCDSCIKLAVVLEGVAAQLEKENVLTVKLFKNSKAIRRRYLYHSTRNYPVLCFKRDDRNEFKSYHGRTTESNIIQFITNNLGRKRAEVKPVDELIGDKMIVDHIPEHCTGLKVLRRPKRVFKDYTRFENTVLHNSCNALLVFYGWRWLLKKKNHKFEEDLNDLADDLGKDNDLVINLVEARDIDYYPTILKALVEVMHNFRTLHEDDEPTIFFKTASGKIVPYCSDDIAKEEMKFFIEQQMED